MTLRFCDGPTLTRAIGGALATLERHASEVDALNVFPVPDGDTGRNMLTTMRAAMAQVERLARAERTLSGVGDALAYGALLGARGNSGVILSQVLRGMADGAPGRRRTDGRGLATALRNGSRAAEAAVPRPLEGTMLTVVRAAADAATSAAEQDPAVETVLGEAVRAASRAVVHTRDQLPVLREAGVVDAGGRGFELLLRGTLLGLADTPPSDQPWARRDHPLPGHLDADGQGYGYETMYLVCAPDERPLDLDRMRSDLGELGQSVLVVGDRAMARVHLHSDRPDQALAYGLGLGRLSGVIVEDMAAQAADRPVGGGEADVSGSMLRVTGPEPAGPTPPAAPIRSSPRSAFAIVAVAAGEGIIRAFTAAGVRALVPGAKGANPSTGEIAAAIRAADADAVVVLPNDANARLAAEGAAALTPGIRVIVVPSRTAAEGIAAALAVDPRADPAANAARMRAVAAAIRSFSVTRAVRDARLDGRRVARGDFIALDPDDRLLAHGPDAIEVALRALDAVAGGCDLVTLYAGAGTDPKQTADLETGIRARYPGIEVEALDGGQPFHAWLVAAE